MSIWLETTRSSILIDREYKHSKEDVERALGTSRTFMSNFQQLVIPIIDIFPYYSSEGYYMSLRTNIMEEKRIISEAKNGREARLARKVFTLEQDELLRCQYMLKAVREKFFRNMDLAIQLEATGELPIIEKNWWKDTLFGVDDKTYVGANMLGLILQEVRWEIRQKFIL